MQTGKTGEIGPAATAQTVAAKTDAPPPDRMSGPWSPLEVEILRGPPYKLAVVWRLRIWRVRWLWKAFRRRLRERACTIRNEARSLLGHIRFAIARPWLFQETPPFDLPGELNVSAWLLDLAETRPSNIPPAYARANGHRFGRQRLAAKFPWAGPVDQWIFLEGWRAAEEWYAQNQGSADCRIGQPQQS
jgi:hypothetical protein